MENWISPSQLEAWLRRPPVFPSVPILIALIGTLQLQSSMKRGLLRRCPDIEAPRVSFHYCPPSLPIPFAVDQIGHSTRILV